MDENNGVSSDQDDLDIMSTLEAPNVERESLLPENHQQPGGTTRPSAVHSYFDSDIDNNSDDLSTPRSVLSLCVILPALTGLALFALYELSYTAVGNNGETKAKTKSMHMVAPTILISIDGFRHDYMDRIQTGLAGQRSKGKEEKWLAPTLRKLAEEGVRAEPGMEPVMPSETFPNHWSLVTGLYPESHGIVSNVMYSPITHQWFHYAGKDPHWWSGEPIWQTLRYTPRLAKFENGTQISLGGNYTTGCVFWVGSDVPRHLPDVFWPYDKTVPYDRRVDRVVDLLTGQAKDFHRKVDFVTLYFEGVDTAGHAHGPNSTQVNSEIVRVDTAIDRLIRLVSEKVEGDVNIIVVSDHGMTEVSDARVVDLTPIVPQGTVQDVRTTPMGMWLNVTVSVPHVLDEMRAGLPAPSANASVYSKDTLLERWHLAHSPFTTNVVTLADIGWTVKYPHQTLIPDPDSNGTHHQHFSVSHPPVIPSHRASSSPKIYGNHGFDNIEPDMQASFIASGPAFKSGAVVKSFRNIDLYVMLCHIFSAIPAPNNGSLDISTASILRAR